MKLKYRNITVPYRIYDNKENYTYYIYNDKKYTDLNKLFNGSITLNYETFSKFKSSTATEYNVDFDYNNAYGIEDVAINKMGTIKIYAGWKANEYEIHYDTGELKSSPIYEILEKDESIAGKINILYPPVRKMLLKF